MALCCTASYEHSKRVLQYVLMAVRAGQRASNVNCLGTVLPSL